MDGEIPRQSGEENEVFIIRVWKPLPSRRVLKTLRESPKTTISASGRLEPLQMVSEPDTRRYACKEARGGHEAVCQQGCWAPKGGGLGGPTSIGLGNKCQ